MRFACHSINSTNITTPHPVFISMWFTCFPSLLPIFLFRNTKHNYFWSVLTDIANTLEFLIQTKWFLFSIFSHRAHSFVACFIVTSFRCVTQSHTHFVILQSVRNKMLMMHYLKGRFFLLRLENCSFFLIISCDNPSQ